MTLIRGEDGQPRARLSIGTDVTEMRQLEEQFLRAQRMENLGRRAAGLAHDFNNILAPILMASNLFRLQGDGPPNPRLLDMLEKSAERGAALVRQILAFDEFAEGNYDTGVIERFQKTTSAASWISEEHKVVALLAAAFFKYEEEEDAHSRVVVGRGTGKTGKYVNPWKRGVPPRSVSRW